MGQNKALITVALQYRMKLQIPLHTYVFNDIQGY